MGYNNILAHIYSNCNLYAYRNRSRNMVGNNMEYMDSNQRYYRICIVSTKGSRQLVVKQFDKIPRETVVRIIGRGQFETWITCKLKEMP
jgi:hypothetical protein